MQYAFGSGVAWGVPTIDLTGTAVATPTPVPLAAMQEISCDISSSTKQLFGLYQFALAVARGTAKITGKAKMGRFDAAAFNLCFGETPVAGENKVSYQEAQTVTGNNATVNNNSTFLTDLGVTYSSNGVSLTRGATASGPGIYACNTTTGIYTFNNADNNAAVKISYVYTTSLAPGSVITLINQLLGHQPFFKLVMNQTYAGKNFTLTLNRCISSKLSFATKLEDWNIPEFDFEAMADDSNIVGTMSTTGT